MLFRSNGKGGTGKTTMTVLLAAALADAGHAAAVMDHDPQATATKWLAEAAPEGVEIARAGGEYAGIFVDTPPVLTSPKLAAAIREADVVVVVSSPSPADLWTSRDTAALVKEHLRPKAKARILFNQVQANTVLAREMTELADKIGLKPLKATVHRRQCYQHAALLGWKGLTTEARNEITTLALEVVVR